ncbi:MAG: hypothetical protein JKY94_09845 [Rhodobacteraceae bacterium]|nr:hypothetical protein [Paracoccaceae bacterium]
MPIDKLILILVCVIGAAGVTVWLSTFILLTVEIPHLWIGLIPVTLAGYVLWRVISERVNSAEDTHYDEMDH